MLDYRDVMGMQGAEIHARFPNLGLPAATFLGVPRIRMKFGVYIEVLESWKLPYRERLRI